MIFNLVRVAVSAVALAVAGAYFCPNAPMYVIVAVSVLYFTLLYGDGK
jgi:hypothetical protein